MTIRSEPLLLISALTTRVIECAIPREAQPRTPYFKARWYPYLVALVLGVLQVVEVRGGAGYVQRGRHCGNGLSVDVAVLAGLADVGGAARPRQHKDHEDGAGEQRADAGVAVRHGGEGAAVPETAPRRQLNGRRPIASKLYRGRQQAAPPASGPAPAPVRPQGPSPAGHERPRGLRGPRIPPPPLPLHPLLPSPLAEVENGADVAINGNQKFVRHNCGAAWRCARRLGCHDSMRWARRRVSASRCRTRRTPNWHCARLIRRKE